ncbi:MAG TPA: DegT/DnrJ/EryC1/StrS family aminotransferase [Catalimonadaceae bacterium]|nr:DegT/DnrJ/EryC1/StrS family aminotransferase [Catalimonadaceae bacterium]
MDVPFVSFSAQNERVAEESKAVFARFFDSQYYVLGNMTKQFEEDYARFNQVKHAVGISNGLDALHLALKVLGVGPGDEVIVPSNTYIATNLAVEMAGATPVFAEPDTRTCNISPAQIRNVISSKTKAIMPVHLYGQACEMDEIMSIAKEASLFVIEDNAQGHAALFNGKQTGSFGHVNATSFYPTKNVGAYGEAGAITTDSDEWAQLSKVWRNYGSEKRYHNMYKGYNNRIDELQAGLLSVKLKYIAEWTAERQRIGERYLRNLTGTDGLVLPYTHPEASHVYHLFVVRCDHRDELQSYLEQNGVKTVIHYPIPPHLQEAYKSSGFKKGDYPLAEMLAETSLSLPLFPGISDEQVDYVSDLVRKFFKS